MSFSQALLLSFKTSASSLLTGLVSYYKLDESSGNAADSVGSYTLTNNSVTYAAAKINNGAVFNGSSSRFDAATGAIPSSGDFTFSFWFYGNSATGMIACDWVILKRNVFLYSSSNAISLYRGGGDATQSATPTTSTTIATNTWTHVVFTQSGTTGTVYINGTSNATSNLTYTGGASTGNGVNIGYYNNGSPSAFINATLDEIGTWNRALTSTEVTSLYNAGTGLQYPF